jgi:branched-chain amino acid transport system permease protein
MIRYLSWKRLISGLTVVLLFIGPPAFVTNPYWFHVIIMAVLNIGMAASLRLIFVAGEISLCHAAFMGIGAYTSTVLVKNLGCSFWLAMPAAGLVSTFIAIGIGYATLRAKGIYFIIVTLAFGEVVRLVISNWPLLGEVNGISDIPPPDSFLGIDFTNLPPNYYLIFLLTLITLIICYRVEKSRFGLIFRSIAQAEMITESVGINIMSYKVLAFSVACFFAGMFGSYYAQFMQVVHPDMFGIVPAIKFLIYWQFGGVSSIWGAVVGAVVLTFVSEYLRAMEHLEIVSYGFFLIVVVLFLPDGVISLPMKIREIISRWKEKGLAIKEGT